MTPDALARLHAAAMDGARPWSRDEFADLLPRPETVLAATPQAFALGRVLLDEAELLMLAVDPACRRNGLGRRCLHDLHVQAVARGAVRIFLEVDAENAAARALYDAMGYEVCGRRRGYYAHPGRPASDAIVMACALPRLARSPCAG
ncbi:GNAT family N-acetyltransferase [Oceaniglobus indicus]|uniref:GNAT family N-acetyltransferase n=1 Tax=Oceaniglobus indicus TaxID=2047749 RepID=UPI000C17579E|nr:GNAT family N-acetyltransferase [Oceaniglobus indicus]